MLIKVDNNFLDLVREELTTAFSEIVSVRNKYRDPDKGEFTMNDPMGMEDGLSECVAEAITKVLGVNVQRDGFSWQKKAISNGYLYHYFNIGTKTIDINSAKSLEFLKEEIISSIILEFQTKEHENHIIMSIMNNGMFFVKHNISLNLDEYGGIKGVLNYLGEHRYCDDEFEELVSKLGYTVKRGNFHNLFGNDSELPYIEYYDQKIWLEVLEKPYTAQRRCYKRLRLEVLYLLECLHFNELLPDKES